MRRDYWWLVCRDDIGKIYLVFGSAISEEDARRKGLDMLGGADFIIKKLPTRDLGQASALYRGNRLKQTHSLTQASQRLGHEKSIDRIMNRNR